MALPDRPQPQPQPPAAHRRRSASTRWTSTSPTTAQSTADKVHEREEFRLLVGDIHELPETQRTALVLREMDALSYEQIAEAMETTVPSVKSLLVRARVSLAEAAEARLLSCDEVRIELGEVAEGLRRRPSPLVRRHLRACHRCASFRASSRTPTRRSPRVLPLGPLVLLKKLLPLPLGRLGRHPRRRRRHQRRGRHGRRRRRDAARRRELGGFVSAGVGAIATKAAAGLAAAALLTGAAVEVDHVSRGHRHHASALAAVPTAAAVAAPPHVTATAVQPSGTVAPAVGAHPARKTARARRAKTATTTKTASSTTATSTSASASSSSSASTTASSTTATVPAVAPGRTQTQTDPTVLAPPPEQAAVTPVPPPVTGAAVPAPSSTATSTSPTDQTSTSTSTSTSTDANSTRGPGASTRSLTVGPVSEIEFEQFLAVDMRVGRVIEVEDFPEARKPAWKLRIDFGPELGIKRSSAQIVHYSREELLESLVVAVVNFAPRQVGPVRSEVLVLGALDDQRGVVLLRPDRGAEPGARIG